MLLMGKSTISMAIFHCYVSSPEGRGGHPKVLGFYQLRAAELKHGRVVCDPRWQSGRQKNDGNDGNEWILGE